MGRRDPKSGILGQVGRRRKRITWKLCVNRAVRGLQANEGAAKEERVG